LPGETPLAPQTPCRGRTLGLQPSIIAVHLSHKECDIGSHCATKVCRSTTSNLCICIWPSSYQLLILIAPAAIAVDQPCVNRSALRVGSSNQRSPVLRSPCIWLDNDILRVFGIGIHEKDRVRHGLLLCISERPRMRGSISTFVFAHRAPIFRTSDYAFPNIVCFFCVFEST
jgi:hypothetical protein